MSEKTPPVTLSPAPVSLSRNPAAPEPSPPMRARESTSVLRNRSYVLFQTGNIVSNMGTFIEVVAQSWLVYELTGNPFWVGLHSLAVHAPVLLVGLPAGALADRFPRRRILITLLTVWAALAVCMAVLSGMEKLGAVLIIVIAALEGVCSAGSRPAMAATTQDVVGRTMLPQALAFNSAAFNVARMVGPAAGGLILASFGPTANFSINALSFLVAIFALSRLKFVEVQQRSRGAMHRQIMEAVRYGLADRGLRRAWLGTGLFCFCIGPVQGLLVAFTREAYGGDERLYGYMLSTMACGAITGAWIAARAWKHFPRHKILPVAAAAYALFGLLLSETTWYPLGVVLMVAVGACHSSFLITCMTVVQLLSPPQMRARILSVHMMMFGMMSLGSLAAGLLAEQTTTPFSYTVHMLVLSAIAAAMWLFPSPEMDRDPNAPSAPVCRVPATTEKPLEEILIRS